MIEKLITAESKDGHKFEFKTENHSKNPEIYQEILDSKMQEKGWDHYEYKIINVKDIAEVENARNN